MARPFTLEFRLERQFSARVVVECDGDETAVGVQVLDMAVGFRDSIRRIRDQICPLLEEIERTFSVAPAGRKYGLTAYFRDENPYFGVFVQKLKMDTVDVFNLTIRSDTNDRVISVSRDHVSVVADSLGAFRTVAEGTFGLAAGVEL